MISPSRFPLALRFVIGAAGAFTVTSLFSGCLMSQDGGNEGALPIDAIVTTTWLGHVVTSGVVEGGVDAIIRGTNRGDEGVMLDPETHMDIAPTPPEERSAMGHYHDSIPATTQARQVKNVDLDWVGLSLAPLYIFDSGINLQGHTGWGGVIEGFAIMRGNDAAWYGTLGVDFVYFQTDADVVSRGLDYHETLECYRIHLNGGLGVHFYDFDLNGWVGLGTGATHGSGLHYTEDTRSYTSADGLLQLGARLSWNPVDWLSIFAGYRVMWSMPYMTMGNDPCYPTLSMQSVEVGVSFRF